MNVLKGLRPERVFHYFEELCAIPHGSGNTRRISEYCVNFAAEHGLECRQDALNNVVIYKSASTGYEDHPIVVLQGHLDMVCEKDPDCPLDMEREGLQLCTDGTNVWAQGTTLGGDDGIAVAMALAILEDKTLCHPPLEVLFTTEEETGMDGAAGLDPQWISGRTFLNIDSEQEGVLTVGCAGGVRAEVTLPVTRASCAALCYRVTVDGLIGGHSGVEIDKGRLNAAVVLGQFLHSLSKKFFIVSLCGGNKDNAIPRKAECVVCTKEDLIAAAQVFTEQHRVDTDPDLRVKVTLSAAADAALTAADSRKVAEFLATVPNGIVAMSEDVPGLVQTSLNLGVLRLDETEMAAVFALRSSVNKEKKALLKQLKHVAAMFGGSCSSRNSYPAWEYRKDSPLRETMMAVYSRLYGKAPAVEIIHAGLECGLFSEKLPGLDAVSFGPDMADIHTSRERLSVASVERTYGYLCEVLNTL